MDNITYEVKDYGSYYNIYREESQKLRLEVTQADYMEAMFNIRSEIMNYEAAYRSRPNYVLIDVIDYFRAGKPLVVDGVGILCHYCGRVFSQKEAEKALYDVLYMQWYRETNDKKHLIST